MGNSEVLLHGTYENHNSIEFINKIIIKIENRK